MWKYFFFSPLPSTRLLDHCILLNRLPGGQEAGNFHAAVSTEPRFQNMTHFHSNLRPSRYQKRTANVLAAKLDAADENHRSNVRFQSTTLFWLRVLDSDGTLSWGGCCCVHLWYTRTTQFRPCVFSLKQHTGRSPNHSFRCPFSWFFVVFVSCVHLVFLFVGISENKYLESFR